MGFWQHPGLFLFGWLGGWFHILLFTLFLKYPERPSTSSHRSDRCFAPTVPQDQAPFSVDSNESTVCVNCVALPPEWSAKGRHGHRRRTMGVQWPGHRPLHTKDCGQKSVAHVLFCVRCWWFPALWDVNQERQPEETWQQSSLVYVASGCRNLTAQIKYVSPSCLLLNTSRGSAVSQRAEWLQEGRRPAGRFISQDKPQ